jgi:hypothetical protein
VSCLAAGVALGIVACSLTTNSPGLSAATTNASAAAGFGAFHAQQTSKTSKQNMADKKRFIETSP